jgi:transcriptional regulator with XRE-family HTH domain
MNNTLILPGTEEEKKYETTPTVELVEYIREFFGWSYKEIATALGVSPRTLLRYRKQESAPSPEARAKLETFAHISDLIDVEFTTREGGLGWLKTKVKAFQYQRPIDMLQRGELDPILTALANMYTGTFL